MRAVSPSAIMPTGTLDIADLGGPGPVLLVNNTAVLHPALTECLVDHLLVAIRHFFDQTMLRQQSVQLLKVFCLQLLPTPLHRGVGQSCRSASLHKESTCAALVSLSDAWHAFRILHEPLDAWKHFDAQPSCTNPEHLRHPVHHPVIWACGKRSCVARRREEMEAVFFIRPVCPEVHSFDQGRKHLKGICKKDELMNLFSL